MNYATAPAGTLATPIADNLLTYGNWSHGVGHATEHLSQYLTTEAGELPFGKLLADECLPASVQGHSISREVVADLLGCFLEHNAYTRWFKGLHFSPTNEPPAGSPLVTAMMPYYNQNLELHTAEPGDTWPKWTKTTITPADLLRGITLALPYFPGKMERDEPQDAADTMLDLITGGYSEEQASLTNAKFENYARLHVGEFMGEALRYAANLPRK